MVLVIEVVPMEIVAEVNMVEEGLVQKKRDEEKEEEDRRRCKEELTSLSFSVFRHGAAPGLYY